MRNRLAWLALVAATVTLSTGALADEKAPAEGSASNQDAAWLSGKVTVGFDAAVGFGKVAAVEQQSPASLQREPSNVRVVAPYRVQSYLIGARYQFQSFGIGLRLPLTVATLRDAAPGTTGTNVFTNGGLELAVDMSHKLSDTMTLTPRLGIVAPTAQGDGVPAALSGGAIDTYALYKGAANLAAAMARGSEDNALFFPGRLGFVPSVSAQVAVGSLSLVPYVKLPVMVDVHQSSTERVRVEAVAGIGAGFDALPWLSPGVRLWATVPLAAESGMRDPVVVAEPQVRLHSADNAYGLVLGGVLPLAGALANPYAGAVKAALTARF